MATTYQNKSLMEPNIYNTNNHHNNNHNTSHSPLRTNKNTTAFASKNERFSYISNTSKVQTMPGPGAYNPSTTNYKLPVYHREVGYQDSNINSRANKSSSIFVKKQHQWIWGSNRGSYLNFSGGSGITVGPGTYDASKTLGIGAHETVVGKTNWGKSQRFGIRNGSQLGTKNMKDIPGPGAYQLLIKKQKNTVGSVFKSKSPRSYIQKMISESSLPDFRTQNEELGHNPQSHLENSKSINLSSSNIKQKQKQSNSAKLNKNSVFASKMPRFVSNPISQTPDTIGPGSYELPNVLAQDKSKSKLPKIITVKNEQKKKKKTKPKNGNDSQTQLPGPGSYDTNFKTIQKQLAARKSIVIFNQSRFIQNDQQAKVPGPGAYMKVPNQFRQQLQKYSRSNSSKQKPSFNSSSLRSPSQLPTAANPLCAYNLQYFDLNYRLKKSQQHIQKLKIMEVTVPAFNSKAKR